jgi:hypothetical protein
MSMSKKETLRQILSKIDWKLVLKNAIERRPTSWGDKPVREWRNAGDSVYCALMDELRKRGYVD